MAYSTVRTGIKATLSPLMIKFRILIFRNDIFALRFSEFKEPTYFMDYDSAFFTF